MKKYFVITLATILFITSCNIKPQKFDSEKWKTGDKSIRGSMIEDMKNSKFLQERTKAQIKSLLGKADASGENMLGYEVITISRCYFWRCLMEINFDPQTKKVRENIVVSD
jgi:hypothetical protein